MDNSGNITFDDLDYVGKKEVEESNAKSEQVLETKQDAKFVPNEVNDKYSNISLPSGFIFYDFDTIRVRKFEIRDLAKMHRVMQNESYKMFKDVIQGCVDVDINKLTSGDFKYICYWLRLNSYPKSPMTVEWRSKYGNENIAQVRKSELQVYAPEITKEQLEQWRAEGFEMPTIAFSNIFDQKLDDVDDFLYSNAQFFKGSTWEEKISTMEEYLEKNGLEALNKVKEFDDLVDHGVKEELTVYDSLFDPEVYKGTLETRIKKMKKALSLLEDLDSPDAATLSAMLDIAEKELSDLTKKLEAGEVVQADPETIFLEMDATEFLSPLLTVQHKREN